MSGRKPELVARLEQHEQGSSSTRKEAERSEELVPPSLPVLPCAAPSEPLTETDLNEAFTRGYAGCEEAADQQEDDEGCADDDENDDGDEGRNQCGVDLDEIPAASVNPKASGEYPAVLTYQNTNPCSTSRRDEQMGVYQS